MLAVTSTAILAAVAVVGVFLLGGLAHVLMRAGRNDQRLAQVEHDIADLKEDLRELFRQTLGHLSPSERRQNDGGPH